MEPTLPNGTVVSVVDYGDTSPKRADIVMFHFPPNPERLTLKRIIGLPGDEIQIDPDDPLVYVNGKALEESYAQGATACGRTCGPRTVPDNNYFVMGDNRENSSDSRQGWYVPRQEILGFVKLNGDG